MRQEWKAKQWLATRGGLVRAVLFWVCFKQHKFIIELTLLIQRENFLLFAQRQGIL